MSDETVTVEMTDDEIAAKEAEKQAERDAEAKRDRERVAAQAAIIQTLLKVLDGAPALKGARLVNMASSRYMSSGSGYIRFEMPDGEAVEIQVTKNAKTSMYW